ncbi:MAG: ABC transporter permease, partial [Firmicutes bacterium]|nr:ABC transporter permease [Bacillota bacterium]
QIMYDVPDLDLRQYTTISVLSVAAAVFCTTFSTWVACVSTLRVVPAELMRPRSPKPGKRVILEYIKPLWKRLNFNRKVAARNLLRYKKRFWMTVLGIGGCTALIIAGFGLRSSLLDTMKIQYDDLYKYQAQIVISPEAGDAKIEKIKSMVAESPLVEEAVPCRMNTATASTSLYNTTAYLQVMESGGIPEVIKLRDYDSKETITLDDSGAVIDLKLSEMLGIKPGDSFTLDCDGYYTIRVAAVTEHYLGHFVYMTPKYYESVTGKEYDVNAYLIRLVDGSKETCDELFSQLLDTGGLASVSRVEGVRDTYQSSMERVDFVVVIVILSAAALAMVVLFNLSNINITERRRELATIKVLGFYDVEVTSYVARENVVLTVLGIAAGIGAGHFLHTWLVRSVEIELMMFGRKTDPMSYLWAGLLTAFFSLSVNFFAHRSMKKIDMVESLKSAE